MNSQYLKKLKLPNSPGVYFFKTGSKILYIGKATSLRDRVKSYFNKNLVSTRGPLIWQMILKAKSVEFEKTDSVLEALLREAQLIKKYQPTHNTDLKDDKSHSYIVITKEDFPRVLLVRGKDLPVMYSPESRMHLLGPFPQGGVLKSALKIIRRIFPYRDKCIPNSGKLCFNAQIGLCPGVCNSAIDKNEYRKIIKNLIKFFEGKKNDVVKSFQKEMKIFGNNQEFEKANEIKKRLFSLQHIQDISLLKQNLTHSGKTDQFRIEAYDIAHMSGKEMVGVMVVLEDGVAKKSDYRKFKIRGFSGANDPGALREMLMRRFKHPEWPFPNLIVVDGNEIQVKVANSLKLSGQATQFEVVAVVKDERHKAREILGDKKIIDEYKKDILFSNSEAHRFAITFHRLLRSKKFLN